MRFRDRIFRFFSGRYGMDELNKFLFWTYLALYIILFLVEIFIKHPLFMIFHIVLLALTVFLFFRMLSRNIYKRQCENRKFLTVRDGLFGWFRLQKNIFRDRKTHVYRKCPSCKAVLRLKKIKGKHRAACPRCAKSFDVRI